MNEDEKKLMLLEQERALENVYYKELEDSKKSGIQEGIQQGVQEGIHQKQVSTVKNLLKRGMSIKDIAEIEETTEEEIIKIQKEL